MRARPKLAKQVRVLLRVMQSLRERDDVVHHRPKQRERRRPAAFARPPDQEFEAVDDRRDRAVLVADDGKRSARGRREVALDRADEDRNGRVLEDLLRLRPEHQALDAATPVRRDEDEVAAALLGRVEDRFVRPVAGHDDRVERNADDPRDGLGLRQDRPRLSRKMRVERRRRQHTLERADARRAVVRLRVEERDFRAERAGELDRLLHGVDRERRVVERNHQMAVHDLFLLRMPAASGAQYGLSPMIPARSILRWHGG